MTIRSLLFLAGIILINMTSCKKEVLPDPCGESGELCKYSSGVFIINEGQFLAGNGSVSFYNPDEGTVENDIFEKTNGRPLGDIAQSMTILQDKSYVVVNNSQKIEVVETATFANEASITGFSSPRTLMTINKNKAYVSDLAGKFYVVDLNTNSISKELILDGWTESMVKINDEVFVAQRTSYLIGTEVSNVVVIDASIDEISTFIEVGPNPSGIVVDKNENLWVLCGGDSIEDPSLSMINPITKTIERTIHLEDRTFYGGPSELTASADGNHLYYLNNNLYKISISASTEPLIAHIVPDGYSIYDFGIDPKSGDIYVSDAIDFVQAGKVYRYLFDGVLVDEFDAGIVPGDFAFSD